MICDLVASSFLTANFCNLFIFLNILSGTSVLRADPVTKLPIELRDSGQLIIFHEEVVYNYYTTKLAAISSIKAYTS